jgi:hypothetical protein
MTIVIAQERIVLLQRQCDQRLGLVRGQDNSVSTRGPAPLDRREHGRPFRPRSRRRIETGLRKQVAAVEQEPGVDVPRHAVELALDAIRVPDARKVVGGVDRRRIGDVGVERRERAERDEFGYPRVAELAQIGCGATRERRQQFLVRRTPRQPLDLDVDTGMRTLVFRQKLRDDFAFAAHRPESDRAGAVARIAPSDDERCGDEKKEGAAGEGKAGHADIIAPRR